MRITSVLSFLGLWGFSGASNLEQRDLGSVVWNDIKNVGTCAGCEALLSLLKGIADLGDSIFVSTLTEACLLSKSQDPTVCQGAIALEGPLVAQSLRGMTIGSLASNRFCITFLGVCSYPPVDVWSVPFPSPKPAGGRPVPSGKTPLQFVHFSDIHTDPFYVPGSATNCTKPICCRNDSPQDAPGNQLFPAGPNGDHKCDAPVSLEESMYSAMKQLVPNAAFAIFTGDIVDHAVWNTTQSQNTIDIQNAYGRMGGLGIPIYGVVGNHETSPTNAFEPSAEGGQSQWIYNIISNAWSPWLGSPGQSGESFGAYSAQVRNNLRVISVNTNLWYTQNYYLYTDPMEQDPSGQIAWLVSELDAAEKAGQRVYIIGHMPNGVSDALHDPSNYFDQVVNRYSNTIAAMFYGHTHYDHFQVSYNNYVSQSYNTASAMSYICPSLTPTSGMPAFRVYTVDPDTFAVLDADTYLADMTNPDFQTSGPVWTKYYSAKEAYGPLVSPPLTDPNAELSAAFWHNVTAAFASDSDDFEAYWSRKTRGWNVPACDATCQASEICTIRAGRSEDNCFTPSPGINFRKRDLHDHQHAGVSECGYSAFGETLSELIHNQGMLSTLELKARLAKV